MQTLKIFYNPSIIKPMFTSLEREIGEKSVIVSNDGKSHQVYLISQEEMTQEQVDLFMHIWRKKKSHIAFNLLPLYAIKLSVAIARIQNASEQLEAIKEQERRERERREAADIRRCMRKIESLIASL